MITLLKSFIVGICAILPGISGSVIAVSFGIYEKFIEIINDLLNKLSEETQSRIDLEIKIKRMSKRKEDK